MEFLQFGEDSQDEIQLPTPLSHSNHQLQPCRFIEDLNKKYNICYPNIDEEHICIRLYDNFKIRSLNQREMDEQPAMNKIQSLDEKCAQKQGKQIIDPEKEKVKPKANMRKRITIEKKLSEYQPLNGPGVIKLKDGKVVFGTWKEGATVGSVKIVYPSGNIYIGEVKNYIRQGKGIFCYKNGYKYDGEFRNGKFSGYGVITDEEGEVVKKGIWSIGEFIQAVK